MSKLDKAEEFYLRGFGSEYIKRRTGISMQSLLKQLRAMGKVYSKDDIVSYQVDYIRAHYTQDDVVNAYRMISSKYPDLERARRGRHVECLGCGFGDYPKVFRAILGDAAYKSLRDECWHAKQMESMLTRYGVSNIFETDALRGENSSMHSDEVKEKRRQTMLYKYGVEHPNQNPEIKSRMQAKKLATVQAKYGVSNAMMVPEIAAKSAIKRQETMQLRYGASNSVQVDAIRNQIFEHRRQNHTMSSSRVEEDLYALLLTVFDESDIDRNCIVDGRYPYHVDFYVKSRDLFIEMNGDKCHNRRWFDSENADDIHTVAVWEEKARRALLSGKKHSRYTKYIEVWTGSDVKKREIARHNNLNYLVFWDSRMVRRNGKMVSRLQDAYAWIAAGCPDSDNWCKENTY